VAQLDFAFLRICLRLAQSAAVVDV
jgi:hypothetical protein